MLRSAPWQAFGSIREDGLTLRIGRVAVAQRWGGLARALTAALDGQAATRGAHDLYLQVEDGNAPARGLYHQLSFSDHHGYHYRVAPAPLA